jgi:hypothetical protein
MQRRCKHAFPTTERLCFLCGPCKEVIKKSSEADRISMELSRVDFREDNLPGYELGSRGTELGGTCRIMARKELGRAKKT